MTTFLIIVAAWFIAGLLISLALGFPLRLAVRGALLSLLLVLFSTAAIISNSERAQRFWNQLDADLTVRDIDPKISWAIIWMLAIPLDMIICAGGIWLARWLI